MGCGSSAEQPRQNVQQPAHKPVAPVHPQQQSQQQPVAIQNEPMKQPGWIQSTAPPPGGHGQFAQQPVQQNVQQQQHVQQSVQQPPVDKSASQGNHQQTTQPPPVEQTAPQQNSPLKTDQPQNQHGTAPQGSGEPSAKDQDEEDEKTDIEIKSVDIVPDLINQYIALEKEIRQMESTGHLKNLKAKMDQLADFTETAKQLQVQYDRCVEKTNKEKEDVDKMNQPSVKAFFRDKFDAVLSKEQEEYLEALNEQEVAKKDLAGVTLQKEKLENEIESKKDDATRLFELYKKQDELLASVFDGKYGSQREYELESQLDMILDRKQRVSVARQKWQNARLLIHHAVTQLCTAVKKWISLAQVPAGNTAMRYTVCTETRNNLVAASQNIGSAQRYLGAIKFPYCKPEEVETLNKACYHIYVDMQSADRYKHAQECYTVTYRRSVALLQWFDHVIENTIVKDLSNSKKAVRDKEKELKQERFRLLKQKIAAQNADFEPADLEDSDDENDDEPEAVDESKDADAVSLTSEDGLPNTCNDPDTGESSTCEDEDVLPPTPLPLNELAPPPSTDDLFGNIDDIKKQHEQEMEEFSKAQEVNKARMDQGLQEKLKARRSRRKRQMAKEEIDTSAKTNINYLNVLKAVMKVTT